MPDLLHSVLVLPGLPVLLLASLMAGLIYGFAGFGAALVFMPLASAVVSPALAVAGLSVAALASVVTVVPKALPQIDRGATGLMLLAGLIAAPLGIAVLHHADPGVLRWGVASVVAVTWVALASGWRRGAGDGPGMRAAVGAACGLVGGATGLTGPVVILFHLSGSDSAAKVRASTMVFLTFLSLGLLPLMALQGLLGPQAITVGLVLLVPYGIGCRIGQALFRPGREHLYRRVALALIAVSVIAGLPVWS